MYNIKDIRVSIQLGAGTFNGGKNTKLIKGLACEFEVEQVSAPDFSKLQGKIYGIGIDDIAKLTTLAFDPLLIANRNLIKIEAGDNGEYSTVFYGELEQAFGDFASAPDVPYVVNGYSSSYAMKLPSPAISIKESVTAVNVITQLAEQAGYKVESTITDTVKSVLYQGSIMQQIYAVATSINAKIIVDGDIIRVMRIDEAVKGSAVLISKNTGLINYPTFTNKGVSLSCIYNPNIKLQGLIKVESIVPKATGTWRVIKLNHSLSAHMPLGGNWQSTMEAVYV